MAQIYPGPQDAVETAQRAGELRCFHFEPGPHGAGMFALIEKPDFVVGYLSFSEDLVEPFPALVQNVFAPYLTPSPAREVCCNVNGRNPRAIAWVQSLGFRLDMHGIKMAYQGSRLPEPANPGWQVSGYLPGSAGRIATLIDRAYIQIIQAAGGDLDPHNGRLDSFTRDLETLQETGSVYTFWYGSNLAAACLVRGDYIRDLAVDPTYQNRELGSAILAHVINDRLARGMSQVRLDVAVSNTGAQRFYTRHGFKEIGCFADHTFPAP